MAIQIEDGEMLKETTDNIPQVKKSTINTQAVVPRNDSLLIGGYLRESSIKSKQQVPCLGDIPGLGLLFRSSARSNTKTNLYVFLTPRVIQNAKEAKAVYSKKRKEIESIHEKKIKLYPKGERKAPLDDTVEVRFQ